MSRWKSASCDSRPGAPSTAKGVLPSSSSNSSAPKPQTSALWSCPFFSTISGARYSGVPQTVSRRTFDWKFAEPKSASFTAPSTNSTFSGFMSRCTMSRSCRCPSADSSCAPTSAASGSENRPRSCSRA